MLAEIFDKLANLLFIVISPLSMSIRRAGLSKYRVAPSGPAQKTYWPTGLVDVADVMHVELHVAPQLWEQLAEPQLALHPAVTSKSSLITAGREDCWSFNRLNFDSILISFLRFSSKILIVTRTIPFVGFSFLLLVGEPIPLASGVQLTSKAAHPRRRR